jgi:hypothetical protein
MKGILGFSYHSVLIRHRPSVSSFFPLVTALTQSIDHSILSKEYCLDAGSHAKAAENTPPRGYVSLTYASSAGHKNAVLLSHGRIFGLLCGSVFLGGWFVVSSVGTLALALSPSLRQMVYTTLVTPADRGTSSDSAVAQSVDKKSSYSNAEISLDTQKAELPQSPVEKLPPVQKQGSVIKESLSSTQDKGVSTKEEAKAPAASQLTRFDRTQVEATTDKLEFRFFLNLLQKGKKQTGQILARAQFRTTDGKLLSVASTLEGGGVYHSGNDPETGIPFTMRHAVRHDLVFLAPEDVEGKFVSVTAKAIPSGGGAVSTVSIPAP